MSTSTQLNLVNRRTTVRMGWVWSVENHTTRPTFALQFAMFESSKRVVQQQCLPAGRASNA
jgi:hypothetical protein